jgi:broad specificity phosphatase PhoE
MGCSLALVTDERLHEASQGLWEGRDREEVYTPAVVERILANPAGFHAPSGESVLQVGDRMLNYMSELAAAAEEETEPQTGVVFGHGYATRIAAGRLQGWTVEQMRAARTPNTSVSLFVYDGQEWAIDFVGRDPAALIPN